MNECSRLDKVQTDSKHPGEPCWDADQMFSPCVSVTRSMFTKCCEEPLSVRVMEFVDYTTCADEKVSHDDHMTSVIPAGSR